MTTHDEDKIIAQQARIEQLKSVAENVVLSHNEILPIMNAYMGSLGTEKAWAQTCEVSDAMREALSTPDDLSALRAHDEKLRAVFQAGAASCDAEVVSLTNQRDYEYVRAENAEQERDQLRAELAAAIAACKVKDEALNAMLERFGIMSDGCIKQASIAIAIQPDDSALKAWLGEPVAEVDDSGVVIVCRYDYKPKDKFYSPKGLK